jgi:hypothetical protein
MRSKAGTATNSKAGTATCAVPALRDVRECPGFSRDM